jgi:predicted transcriptional regulator
MPDEHPDLPPLSEIQLELVNLIWDQERMTVAELWKILQARRGVSRNTVQTMVSRLEDKGWLTHEDEGGTFIYRVTIPRDEAQRQTVRKLVDTVFAGSAADLVLTLLNGQTLAPGEAERIRDLIAQAKRRKP